MINVKWEKKEDMTLHNKRWRNMKIHPSLQNVSYNLVIWITNYLFYLFRCPLL
jgi:hypothetical protein